MRGRPYFRSSTLTPHQMCRAAAPSYSFVARSTLRRSARFVRTWYVCQFARSMMVVTASTYWSGTGSWKRSLMLLTNTVRDDSQRSGSRSLLRDETRIKAVAIGVLWHPPESLREGFGIAVLASGADLGAAADWVPSRFRPLDFRMFAHGSIYCNSCMFCSGRSSPASLTAAGVHRKKPIILYAGREGDANLARYGYGQVDGRRVDGRDRRDVIFAIALVTSK